MLSEEFFNELKSQYGFKDESEINKLKGSFFQLLKNQKSLSCLYENCSKKPIQSHSIQKSKLLKNLADSTNHVIMLTTKLTLDRIPIASSEPIGINEASCFPGFCKEHDKTIFRPIEDQSIDLNNNMQSLLLSYRSFCKEYYQITKNTNNLLEICRNNLQDQVPEAQFISIQLAYKTYETKVFMDNINDMYKKALAATDKHDFYIYQRGVRSVPFAVSSFFTPFFDFDGNHINQNDFLFKSAISLDIIPNEQQTLVNIVVPNLCMRPLISSVITKLETSNENEFLKLIWELALRYSENIVLSPEVWNRMSVKKKNLVESFFNKTTNNSNAWIPYPKTIEVPY